MYKESRAGSRHSQRSARERSSNSLHEEPRTESRRSQVSSQNPVLGINAPLPRSRTESQRSGRSGGGSVGFLVCEGSPQNSVQGIGESLYEESRQGSRQSKTLQSPVPRTSQSPPVPMRAKSIRAACSQRTSWHSAQDYISPDDLASGSSPRETRSRGSTWVIELSSEASSHLSMPSLASIRTRHTLVESPPPPYGDRHNPRPLQMMTNRDYSHSPTNSLPDTNLPRPQETHRCPHPFNLSSHQSTDSGLVRPDEGIHLQAGDNPLSRHSSSSSSSHSSVPSRVAHSHHSS